MEELDFDFPEGFLTPEETARFNKMKSDIVAFYEKHGDHLEWLEQAVDLGLMEAHELTPDERQFTEATMKVVEEHDFEGIEGLNVEEMKAAFERMTELAYLQGEMVWFQELTARKRMEAGKSLLGDFQAILNAAKAHQALNPDDATVNEYIEKLNVLIEQLTTESTTTELNLAARQDQSAN